ncbi:MAG: ABC-type transport auxiliary lipoprotein family protein [Alphaproteobacteria bacterium]|nr:ABC-type transport auxiliary lipoprotein family protein [Alphaproteobacteria bacterium]
MGIEAMDRQGPRQLSKREVMALSGAGVLLGLTGCSVPGSGPPARRVALSPTEDFPPNLPTVAWPLVVNEPAATLSLNTGRIAIGERTDIQYLRNGEWSSRAPVMVMELLVASFKNSNSILVVGDRTARIRPAFTLESRLTGFHILEEGDTSTAVVAIEFTLVQSPRRNAVGQITFDSSTDVGERTLDNIVAAFDESLQDVMSQAVEWTLRTGAAA